MCIGGIHGFRNKLYTVVLFTVPIWQNIIIKCVHNSLGIQQIKMLLLSDIRNI